MRRGSGRRTCRWVGEQQSGWERTGSGGHESPDACRVQARGLGRRQAAAAGQPAVLSQWQQVGQPVPWCYSQWVYPPARWGQRCWGRRPPSARHCGGSSGSRAAASGSISSGAPLSWAAWLNMKAPSASKSLVSIQMASRTMNPFPKAAMMSRTSLSSERPCAASIPTNASSPPAAGRAGRWVEVQVGPMQVQLGSWQRPAGQPGSRALTLGLQMQACLPASRQLPRRGSGERGSESRGSREAAERQQRGSRGGSRGAAESKAAQARQQRERQQASSPSSAGRGRMLTMARLMLTSAANWYRPAQERRGKGGHTNGCQLTSAANWYRPARVGAGGVAMHSQRQRPSKAGQRPDI